MSELDTVHAVLRKALRELAPDEWPARPIHGGGPLLVCPALEQIRISLRCADRSGQVVASERTTARKVRDAVEAFLELARTAEMSELRKKHDALDSLGEGSAKESPHLYCLRRAASGAATYARGKPDLVFPSATASVMRVVKLLTKEERRAFLGELDQRMRRAELASVHRERLKTELPPVDEVLFRAADPAGKCFLWIARLPDARFALFGRLDPAPKRAKWSWIEGSRDDVLANVPDTLFAAAAERVTSVLSAQPEKA